MFIFKSIRITFVTLITTAILLIAGCGGGSDGGGGGGVNFPTPTLPTGAVAFNSTNAVDVTDAAFNSAGSLTTATAPKGTNLPSTVQNAIDLVTDRLLSRAKNSQSVATGVTTIDPCLISGTVTETSNVTATGGSGTITFADCQQDLISTINGSFSFIVTINDPIFDFDIGGNLTFTLIADSSVITMVMNLSQTFDTLNLVFTISQTFSVSGILIGTPPVAGGFLVTTTVPLVVDFALGVTSGELLIQGANGTQIRITVIAPDVASVEVDDGSGFFVMVDPSYAI